MNELENFLKESLLLQNDLGVNNIFDFTTGNNFSKNNNTQQKKIETTNKIPQIDNNKQQIKSSTNDVLLNINDFDALVEEIKKIKNCDLKLYAKNDVIYDGCKKAEIMLIGEAPGEKEDIEGKPFCGQSGKLLRSALEYINLNNNNLLITNTIYWRPPENRNPTEEELQICKPFLLKMIEIVNPKIIILCGSVAANSLLNTTCKMSEIIGKVQECDISFNNFKKRIKVFPVYHPSYLLRQPSVKKIFWQHLLNLKNEIEKLGCIK